MSEGFFDPKQPYFVRRGNLPHWRQEGALYFVTFRLADSIPEKKIRIWNSERLRLRSEMLRADEVALRRHKAALERRLQKWLDCGWGSCILTAPGAAACVKASMEHFNGTRYALVEDVIAANHVHALVRPALGVDLSAIVSSWKRYTANQLWRIPQVREAMGRSSGSIWQEESFDHIVRNQPELDRIVEYIRQHKEWKK